MEYWLGVMGFLVMLVRGGFGGGLKVCRMLLEGCSQPAFNQPHAISIMQSAFYEKPLISLKSSCNLAYIAMRSL